MSASETAMPRRMVASSAGLGSRVLAVLPIAFFAAVVFAWLTRPSGSEAVVVATAFGVPTLWFALRLAPGEAASIRRTAFATHMMPLAIAPLGFLLVGAEGWIATRPLTSLTLVTVTAAAAATESSLRWARRTGPGRVDTGDSTAGSSFAGPFALAFPAIACSLLALDFAAWSDLRRSDASRAAIALNMVDALARVDAGRPLGERIDAVLPRSTGRAAEMEGFSIASDGRVEAASQRPDARLSATLLEAVDRARETDAGRGVLTPRGGAHLGAYRVLDDGTVLVIRVDRRGASGPFAAGAQAWGFFGLLFVAVAWRARRLDRDRAHAVERVRRGATILAEGRLNVMPEPDPGSELGDVEARLARAAGAFAGLVERAASTSQAVSGAVEEVATRLEAMERAGADRAARLDEARRSMERIQAEAGNASDTTGQLDRALDESAHSVLELGSAGDELNETASILGSKVDDVSDSLEQMVRSVKQVGATTDRLAEASEETSSSMEEMASAMRAVDTAAETTANLSSDVVEKAELGQAKVVQTIAGMEAIREATDAAESVIRGLGARTKEIGGILDVIDDVADETNLLALNAAIIAAQAGEQGKAFSVVADEIKELADRVLASTKEIGGLIRSVQEESENAIGAIEAGSSSVMSGVDLSAEAGKTLEEITVASRESGTRIREIVSSVREQTKAASHVVNLMERVRESADQIGAASAQQDQGNEIVYRSALTMREVAQQVRRTTEEQSAGFGRIKENVVGVRGAVELIGRALTSQSTACAEVARSLDAVDDGDRANAEAMTALRETLDVLGASAASLRDDIDGFRS